MIIRLIVLFCLGTATLPAAGRLHIAAAANLVHVMEPLAAAFLAAHPDIKLQTSFGSSGGLVAQISHGAPYDVFLSADLAYPQSLIASGHADATSLKVFARGQLVLWTTRSDLKMSDLTEILSTPSLRRVAIANPETAPYGQAAQQTLEQLHLWILLKPKIVFGENISHTAQFVESGNADVGFVALSAVLSPQLATRGKWLLVPAMLYTPLEQGAVLTTRGTSNPAARVFLRFLLSPEAQDLFSRYGYGTGASQ